MRACMARWQAITKTCRRDHRRRLLLARPYKHSSRYAQTLPIICCWSRHRLPHERKNSGSNQDPRRKRWRLSREGKHPGLAIRLSRSATLTADTEQPCSPPGRQRLRSRMTHTDVCTSQKRPSELAWIRMSIRAFTQLALPSSCASE